jgi:O-acetyl-ADP-ribose deacetylase (regulator of RNase III)
MPERVIVDGNIFTSKCQTLVNTVNCVGVMGAGIALECRLRYPSLYSEYVALCSQRRIQIGRLWLFKAPDRWILNFPTKAHWRDPSREEYLHAGSREFMESYEAMGIESIAFPLLGARHGGIERDRSQEIMESYLLECRVPVEIYRYDPMAPDDLYDRFRALLADMTVQEIAAESGLRTDYAQRVVTAMDDPGICQLNRLASVRGIGVKTLEKVFTFARRRLASGGDLVQLPLGI